MRLGSLVETNADAFFNAVSLSMQIQPYVLDQLPHCSNHRCNLYYIAPCHFSKEWIQMSSLCRPNDQLRVTRDSVTFLQRFVISLRFHCCFCFHLSFFSPFNHKIALIFLFCLHNTPDYCADSICTAVHMNFKTTLMLSLSCLSLPITRTVDNTFAIPQTQFFITDSNMHQNIEHGSFSFHRFVFFLFISHFDVSLWLFVRFGLQFTWVTLFICLG